MDPKKPSAPEQLVFGWIDYTLFSSLIGLSLFVGVFFGFCSKQDSADEYLFGGKRMKYFPVAVSVLASMVSGITLLGVPTEVYLHGAEYITNMGMFVLAPLITAYMFIPVYYKLQLSSSYEYLELRFSKRLRRIASVLYIISLLMYIPMVVYVPALAFSQVTGYNLHVITLILSIVCITYTTMGGVKAVIWTDTIQFLFTMTGLFAVLAIGFLDVGGVSKVFEIASAGQRLEVINLDLNPFIRTSLWSYTIGGTFAGLGYIAVSQKFIQRFMTIEKEANIQKALHFIVAGGLTICFICILMGLIIYAKFHECNPLTTKVVQRSDQIVPYFVMKVASSYYGLPGLFLSGIVSSGLATMSASLNTLSGCIYQDFIDQWIADGPNKNARAANIMKLLSVVLGLATLGLIFLIENLGTVFELAMTVKGVAEGPLLGLFIAGMAIPTIGKKGAFYGVITSTMMMTWIIVGSKWHFINKTITYDPLPFPDEQCEMSLGRSTLTIGNTTLPTKSKKEEPFILFKISMLYFTFFGTFVVILVGSIVSFVVGESKHSSKVNHDYLTPLIYRFLPKKTYIEVPMQEMKLKKINK